MVLIHYCLLVNAVQDSNLSNNNMLVTINISTTRGLNQILYVPIDNIISDYETKVNNAHDFIQRIYPVKDNIFNKTIISDVYNSGVGLLLTDDEQCDFIESFFKGYAISGTLEYRVIGVVNNDWFNQHGMNGTGGYTCHIPFVAIVTNPRHIVAHEIGHTFGLCDEYLPDVWKYQDTANHTTVNLCPNGDEDNNNELDTNCYETIKGCPTTTDTILDSYLSSGQLKNIMGSGELDNLRWITKSSYTHILEVMDTDLNYQNARKSLLVSGKVYRNNSVVFDPIYTLENKTLINRTGSGNYSINVIGSQNYSRNFSLDYSIHRIDGNSTEMNYSNFAFLLPVENNSNSVQLYKNGALIKEINVSLHIPRIVINQIDNSEPLSEPFNITWNASDADGNPLYYAVLISPNNGTNYTTLAIDYTNTIVNNFNFRNF